MKVFGNGVLTAPRSRRVVWDFADGPFDTSNPDILAEAKRIGCTFGDEAVEAYEEAATAPEPAQEPKRAGRPKGAKK